MISWGKGGRKRERGREREEGGREGGEWLVFVVSNDGITSRREGERGGGGRRRREGCVHYNVWEVVGGEEEEGGR